MFIVFEGLDGSGKTSAMEATAEILRARGYHVLTSYEPGGSPASDRLRQLVKTTRLSKSSQTLIMASARIENHINGALGTYRTSTNAPQSEKDKRTILLCDRYDASTFVYQSLGEHPLILNIYESIASAHKFLVPDLYVSFDVTFEESQRRRRKHTNRSADVAVDADVLEAQLESKSNFDDMRKEYRNFFVSKLLSRRIPHITIDTTELSEDEKLKALTENLDAYLIPISECVRS